MKKWEDLEIIYDKSHILEEYLATIANKKLLVYKSLIHTGGKAGESLWAHIMNLVMVTEKIRPLFNLDEIEYRCQLLALTIHDLNKIAIYGNRSDDRPTRYANAAREGNIRHELKALGADLFFPEWEEYLWDIKYLADAHNEKGQMDSQSNEEYLERCLLNPDRLEGPLRSLMKMADVSDNSHSGEYTSRDEKHIRDKLSDHLNAALNASGHPRRYRFIGHRLSELRALLTNLIHNQVVEMLQEAYGEDLCIDILYHAEGVDYLLDKKTPLVWNVDQSRLVAESVARRIADMQAEKLAQFIKAKPHGISVDDAAIQSGVTVEQIFTQIQTVVLRKLYRAEWLEQRNALVRNDLEKVLADSSTAFAIKEQVTAILAEVQVLPTQEDVLRRGEYFLAYRNFLREQRGDQLRAVKQNEWERALRLFQCPVEAVTISQFIDPYRRAYFVARYLPAWTIAQMEEMVLKDLVELDEQAKSALAKRQGKKKSQEAKAASQEQVETDVSFFSLDPTALVDYLQRNLVLWDSDPKTKVEAPVVDFRASLRRYADPKRPDTQCCYCGSPLQAEEWMAMQVPPNIGVQSFSNRLAGGSSREPKRNVCEICRTQFLLEKLSYQSHSDKQGKEYLTFYMHLFPYSFFTQPLLEAWWLSIRKLQENNQTSLLVNAQDYLLQWQQHPRYFTRWQEDYQGFQEKVMVSSRSTEGVTIPAYAELVSNVPVFPLVVKESHHGHKFLSALEKAAVLTRWFDCRLLLSRLPTPVLNLAEEYRDGQPVVLLIENVPQALRWLVPDNTLLRDHVKELCRKLGVMHTIAQLLAADDEQLLHVVYDLVSAAALDPLAIYHETDRLIEKKVTQKKSKQPAQLAIQLSHQVAPLLKQLNEGV